MVTAQDPAVTVRPPWYRRPHLQVIATYLLVRLLGVLVLGLVAAQHDMSLVDRLTAWDGQWYLSIAADGYDGVGRELVDADGEHTPATSRAFFPAYPILVRVLALVTLTDVVVAGLAVSLVAGVVAAYGIFRVGCLVDGRARVGLILVALWAGAPMAITLSMTYTESLFTALAAWALVGVLERRWVLAGLCCAAAGLVRPTASVLIAVVAVAALISLFRARSGWPAVVGLLLCPVGLLGYWSYVATVTGSPTGWFDLEQQGWSTRYDGGQETLQFAGEMLVTGRSVMETGTVFIVLAAGLLAVLGAVNRVPWPLVGYAACLVVLVAGTAGLPFIKARLLVPGFALLVPVALGLAGRRLRTAVAATAGFVLFGCWFSAYALTGWRYAI